MSVRRKKLLTLFIPAIVVLVFDQITKYMVRTNPGLQRVEVIEGWLAFNFTKNPGMALGMDWLSTQAISIVAILATVGIFTYIFLTLRRANFAYLACMGLILGGALGNITDRIFMGIVGGYGGVLDGHVVDFIHFTLTIGSTPVFPYIFNIADVAISTSIIIMLIFHRSIMPAEQQPEEKEKGAPAAEKNEKEESDAIADRVPRTDPDSDPNDNVNEKPSAADRAD